LKMKKQNLKESEQSSTILKSKRKDLMLVDPRNIIIQEGFNIRHDLGDISSLMQSIQEFGLQVPIKAKKVYGTDKWEVVDGHRRMMAINSLIELGVPIEFVEVSIFSGDVTEKILSMLITGTGQKPLTEYEQSEGIGRLIDSGEKPENIAKKIGKSIPHIYHLLKIYSLPEKYKQKIRDGYISGYTMLELFEDYSDEELDYELEMVIDNAQQSAKNGEVKKATAKNMKKDRPLTPMEKFKILRDHCELQIDNQNSNLLHVFILEMYDTLTDVEVEDATSELVMIVDDFDLNVSQTKMFNELREIMDDDNMSTQEQMVSVTALIIKNTDGEKAN